MHHDQSMPPQYKISYNGEQCMGVTYTTDIGHTLKIDKWRALNQSQKQTCIQTVNVHTVATYQ